MNKMAGGTWFQPFGKVDYPKTVFKKNKKYWAKEFRTMKELNFDTFIFQFAVHDDVSYYKSDSFKMKRNILDIVSNEVIKNKFDFALGLYLNSDYYESRDYKKVFDEQFQKTKLVFDELLEKYKDFPNLKYWYIPQEIETTTFPDDMSKQYLVDFMIKIVSHIRSKSDLPIMIAPYFSLDEFSNFKKWWIDFLSRVDIDIMIMQDGMGCYRDIQLEDVASYYAIIKDICKSYNVKFWSTLEIFNFVNAPDLNNKKIKIVPAEKERVLKQIEINSQYADKIIFFEFAHFMSPQFSRASKQLYAGYTDFIKSLL